MKPVIVWIEPGEDIEARRKTLPADCQPQFVGWKAMSDEAASGIT
jgi:hypothetical protein